MAGCLQFGLCCSQVGIGHNLRNSYAQNLLCQPNRSDEFNPEGGREDSPMIYIYIYIYIYRCLCTYICIHAYVYGHSVCVYMYTHISICM